MTDIVSNSQDKIESWRMRALKEKILFCERESEINRVQFLLRTILIIIVTLSLIIWIIYISDIFAPKDFEGQLYNAFYGATWGHLISQIIFSLITCGILLATIYFLFQQIKKRAHQWNGEVFIKRSKVWFIILSVLYILWTCFEVISYIWGSWVVVGLIFSLSMNMWEVGLMVLMLLTGLLQIWSIFYIWMGLGILWVCLLKKWNNQKE